jgi:hypothetical protein
LHLDGVDVFGAFVTVKQKAWLSSTELRLFNILYRDSRPSTDASLGDRLLIDAVGGSLVGFYPAGSGAVDLMLWSAFEFGDFGASNQAAAAFIAEGGYVWQEVKSAPWIRFGIAYSSGDDDPFDGDHNTFFNMVPTNHKWYGAQDFNAFQNLTNFYGQFRLQPHPQVGLNLEGHSFWLSESADAWYGGSGPANNLGFGYVARRPLGGFRGQKDIGTEVDLIVNWRVDKRVGLQFGVSYFRGGDVAKAVLPVKDDSTWAYFQLVVTP